MQDDHKALPGTQESLFSSLCDMPADLRRDEAVHDRPFSERPAIITSPRQLARYLNVPIVMITIMAREDLLIYDGFGLAPGRILGKLSKICHQRCREGAHFKADIIHDPDFAAICKPADISDSRFFIGVPVYGKDNMLIGTAALLDRRRNIMTRRNLFRNLHDSARSFIEHRPEN